MRTALLLSVFLALAPTTIASDQVIKGSGRFPFEQSMLDNGLTVLSLEDHSTPIVAVQLWYHVGSKDEQPERQGFAHMFEHMMFRGTDRTGPTDHFDFIRRTGGACNAYTAFDQTVYVEEAPANQLDMILWLEAERMAALKIDAGGFATERKVVEEERRLGLNQPYGLVLEQVLAQLFTKHPYRWSPIGKIEHLRAATANDIQHFWDTYYVPNNATLVVVGDITHEQVRSLAQKNFGWIPRCPEPPRVTIVEPEQTALRRLDIAEQNGPAPIGGIVFHTVPERHPDALALDMCMRILGDGESSRLYLELVRKQDVAAFGAAAAITFEQAGIAIAGGVAMPVVGDPDEIIAATWEQIEKLKSDGVTPDELEKVRNAMVRADVTESMTVASKASALGQAAVILGDAQRANTRLAAMHAVTREDIQRVARTYLIRKHANEVRIEPTVAGMFSSLLSLAANMGDRPEDAADDEEPVEGGARAVASGPKAAAKRPEGFPEAPPLAPPLDVAIDLSGSQHTLDNGLTVVVVESHEVPFVSCSLRLDVGSYTDDEKLPGTASMAASMVTRGTYARDAEALAAELEHNGISLSAGASHDATSVDVSCVTEQIDRAMRLLAEVVRVPRFDPAEFKTLRDQTATGMAISEKTPAVIADRAFDHALWGEHPYGRPASGTSDDLKKLNAEALAHWWSTSVRPETATLYISGDVTDKAGLQLAQRYLGDWEADGETIDRPLPPVASLDALSIKLVDRRGSVQSEIRAGHQGISRRHPFYEAGVVMSQVFGGAFNSRLNATIRVEKGLTYGARGGLSAERFGGEFKVSTFTKTPKTAETVRAVIDEVKRLQSEPLSDEELNSAVSYLAGSFAGSLETPQAVSSRLWTLKLHGLPDDYWNTYLTRIGAMTSADVAQSVAELIDPDNMIVVVVGDAAEVQDDLEKIAPVELITSGG